VIVMFDSYVGHVLGNVHVPGSGPIWLSDVRCSASCGRRPTDLSHCSHNGWGVAYCSHSEDVSIACYDRTTTAEPTTAAVITTPPGIRTALFKPIFVDYSPLSCSESLRRRKLDTSDYRRDS